MILCIILGAQIGSKACDACGCIVNNNNIGLLTDYRNNFIRMSYGHASFVTSPQHGHSLSNDYFSRLESQISFRPGKFKNLRLSLHLPYGINQRFTEGISSGIQGLGDVRFVSNYTLFRKSEECGGIGVFVEAGGGVSIPTGKYQSHLTDDELPDNFNIGIGAWGGILQSNAVLSKGNSGISISNSLQWNGRNAEDYRFGHQFASQLIAYHQIDIKSLKIVPGLGASYEYVAFNKNERNNKVAETGGEGLFLSASTQIMYSGWSFGLSYGVPVYQYYASGTNQSRSRFAAHLTYFF